MADKTQEELAQKLLYRSYADLNEFQRDVIDLISTRTPSSHDKLKLKDERTFGQKLADKIAEIGGSWNFIIGFAAFLVFWMGWNVFFVHFQFDVYPFIFLNLMLSMLAAIQAPVIMMSQNRAAAKDREAAEHDALVNLRAELEIMHLHDKVDSIREEQLLELLKKQNEAIRLLRKQVEKVLEAE